jgi:cytochrome c5
MKRLFGMRFLRKRFFGLALVVSAIAGFPLLAVAGPKPQQQGAHQQSASHVQKPAADDRGQEVFNENCSRCHNAPEGFSPRISGTVALHMRVRANLSEQDYKALLHFLNP